jgi:hypothetical protein
MKAYEVKGRFTLTVAHGSVVAKTGEGTEQRLSRQQAAKILKKAHQEKKAVIVK